MATLHIEHAVSDFDTWRGAFLRFADHRRAAGVLAERVMQPVDDARYVMIDLEFPTADGARAFLRFLEAQVWSTPANAPALVGTPRARIAEPADLDAG